MHILQRKNLHFTTNRFEFLRGASINFLGLHGLYIYVFPNENTDVFFTKITKNKISINIVIA